MFTSGALLLLLLLTYAFRAPILSIPARFLVIDQQPQAADIIVVLNGGAGERATRGAQLYHQGLAPRIVVARAEATTAEELGLAPNATDVVIHVLTSSGVPADSVTAIPFGSGVTSTRDEALAVRRYAEENGLKSLMLVTSRFHTRRARWIFQRVLSTASMDVLAVAAPYQGFDETNWWKTEDGLIKVNNEFIKLFYYMLRY